MSKPTPEEIEEFAQAFGLVVTASVNAGLADLYRSLDEKKKSDG